MPHSPDGEAQKVAAMRELLPATGAGIYLDTGSAGPLPAETAAAMREAEEWELRVGRAVAGREEDLQQRAAEARAVVAALIGADPDHVGLAAGPEIALGEALGRLDWRAGDRLLLSQLNDQRVIAAARRFCGRLGLEAVVTSSLTESIAPRTRLALLPHVAPGTGELLPIAQIATELEGKGAGLAVDLSWSAGVVPVSLGELRAYVAWLATDRWALGPEETAAFWLSPAVGRPDGQPEVASTGLGRTALLGLARSVGWLEMYVGLEWATERTARLARQLAAALSEIEGLELLTPIERLAGIVSFRLPAAWSAEAAADELGRRVFAIVRPLAGLRALRASVAWFNTEEELERLAAAVAELAGHSPEELPRRPALTVL